MSPPFYRELVLPQFTKHMVKSSSERPSFLQSVSLHAMVPKLTLDVALKVTAGPGEPYLAESPCLWHMPQPGGPGGQWRP